MSNLLPATLTKVITCSLSKTKGKGNNKLPGEEMDKTTVQLSFDEIFAIHALVFAQIAGNEQSIRLAELAKIDASNYMNSNKILSGIIEKLESASTKLLKSQI